MKVNLGPLKDSSLFEIFLDIEVKISGANHLLMLNYSSECHFNELKNFEENLKLSLKSDYEDKIECNFESFINYLSIDVKGMNSVLPAFEANIRAGDDSEFADSRIVLYLDEPAMKSAITQLKNINKEIFDVLGEVE